MGAAAFTDQPQGLGLNASSYLRRLSGNAPLVLVAIIEEIYLLLFTLPRPPQGVEDARRVCNLAGLAVDRRSHVVPRKQIIYAEGDEATRLYFVQAGQVKTSKATAAGKELITGMHQPSDFFVYKGLLAGTQHHDTALAVEDAVLLYIPAANFTQPLLRNPKMSQQFVRLLAGRVREQEELLLDTAYNFLRKRVADALLRLHEQQVALAPAEPLIQLSRDNMTSLVGTAPESLSRTLSGFRQAGYLKSSFGCCSPKSSTSTEPIDRKPPRRFLYLSVLNNKPTICSSKGPCPPVFAYINR